MPARLSVQQHQIVPESLADIPPADVANSSAADWLRTHSTHSSDSDSDDPRVLTHVLYDFLQIDDGSSNETSSETESTEEDEEEWTCGDKDTACSDQLGAYLIIIVTLIAATIVFESLREYMQERSAGLPSRLIVDAIFSELTVLGFLGLLTFLIKKAGTAHLSRAIYGDKPYSENSERFSEDLEDVHMIIFIVMIFFVFQALGILFIMAYFRQDFKKKNLRTLTKDLRVKTYSAYHEMSEREISFVCEPREWLKLRELEDTTIFSLLREEFIKPRAIRLYSQSEPLEQDSAVKRDDGKRDFDFGLYLEHVLAEHLKEVLEVDWKSWLGILVLITAYFGLIWATGRKKDFVRGSWIVMGWGMVLLGWLFQRSLRTAYTSMVPQQLGKQYVKHKKDKEREKRASEEQRRQQVGDVEMREKYAIPQFLEDEGFASESSILDVKRPEYNQKLKNAHQKVLWGMGKKDAKQTVVRVFRMTLLITAILFAVFVQGLMDDVYDDHSAAVATVLSLLCIVPAPVVFVCFLGPGMVCTTMITSIEAMKDSKAIAEVERKSKEQRAIRILQMMTEMRRMGEEAITPSADETSTDEISQMITDETNKSASAELEGLDASEVEEQVLRRRLATRMQNDFDPLFRALDKDGSGVLTTQEIADFINSFFHNGQPSLTFDAAIACARIKAYSGKVDDDVPVDSISRQQFLNWVRVSSKKIHSQDPEEFSANMFGFFDADGDKTLDADEFSALTVKVMTLTGISFTLAEMAAVMSEIDKDGNHELNMHEFADWVAKRQAPNL